MNYLDEGDEIVIAIFTSRTFQACEESNCLFQLFDESVNISVGMKRQMLYSFGKIERYGCHRLVWCCIWYRIVLTLSCCKCTGLLSLNERCQGLCEGAGNNDALPE